MKTLSELLNIEHPIIQAPMAGVQDSALAIAVCNAGGLGSLPCAMLSAEQMLSEIAAIKARTTRPYNLNFFCHTQPDAQTDRIAAWKEALLPYYHELGILPDTEAPAPVRRPFDEDAAAIIEKFQPPIVSFHFGLPEAALLKRVKATGAIVLSSATTVQEALWLEQNGADAIIAQGLEAGGHRGMFLSDDLTDQMGTFALVPQIVAAANVPVIASGGIADRAGVRAALALGAVAAQIGTAYLLCREAKTSTVHRAALKGVAARHTAITNLFSGRPARGIINRFMKEMGPLNSKVPLFPLAASALATLRTKAESSGDSSFSPLWCGQNATGCKEMSASEITLSLMP